MTRSTLPFPWNYAAEISAQTGRTQIVVEGVLADIIADPGHRVPVYPGHPDAEALYVHDAVSGTTRTAELYGHDAYHAAAEECGGSRPVDIVRHLVGLGGHTCEAIHVVSGDGVTKGVVLMGIPVGLIGDPESRLLLTRGGRTGLDQRQEEHWECEGIDDLGLTGLPEPYPGDEEATRGRAAEVGDAFGPDRPDDQRPNPVDPE